MRTRQSVAMTAKAGGRKSRDEGKKASADQKERRTGTRSCLKWIAVPVLLAIAVALILLLPTVNVDPIAYRFSEDSPRGFEGGLEINSILRQAKLLFPGELVQPEAFEKDKEGYVYTGLGDGRLVKLNPDLSNYETVLRMGHPPYDQCGTVAAESHCGRILGLHFHPTNPDIIYAADSTFGLLKINIQTKNLHIIVPQRQLDNEDIPFINFCNDLVVLANESIFFTDSSKKFPRTEVIFDVAEGRGNGQLLHYDPVMNMTHVVLDEVPFPNGMVLSHDKTALLFTETSRARIMRYYLKGAKAGTTDVFLDNLPGLPDNISPNRRGDGYWIAFALTRTWLLDYLTEVPTLRLFIVKLGLSRFIAHNLPKHALIIEVDEDGRILRSFHDDGGKVLGSISHVLDLGDRLLLGSYEAPYAAVLAIDTQTKT